MPYSKVQIAAHTLFETLDRLDLDLGSHGKLSLKLKDVMPYSKVQIAAHTLFETLDRLASGSLADAATAAVSSTGSIEDVAATVRTVATGHVADSVRSLALFNRLARHLRAVPGDASYLEEHLARLDALPPRNRAALFALTAAAGADDLLLRYGLGSASADTRLRATLAAAQVTAPSAPLLESLRHASLRNNAAVANDEQCAGLLAYGALLSRDGIDADQRSTGHKTLSSLLRSSLLPLSPKTAAVSEANSLAECALLAVANAGPRLFPLEEVPYHAFTHDSPAVAAAAAYVVNTHLAGDASGVEGFYESLANFTDLGRNYTFDRVVRLGGTAVSASFDVHLYAGTNFDCKQPEIDYAASATVESSVSLLGFSRQAFAARALYGRRAGRAAADSALVRVWGKVLYSRAFASPSCVPRVEEIMHVAPGYAVDYTLWVSVIPITFTASVSLELDLSWGWRVCDADLSAAVSVAPSASLVFEGAAQIDLLNVLRTGVTLHGALRSEVVPRVAVEGARCEIAASVKNQSPPLEARFETFRAWAHCRLLPRGSCHWGKEKRHTLWSWETAGYNRTLLDGHWKISDLR
eukprot:TRINITY_DN7659_c0_g1_i1.p1 TRINITY_DN7659_c0_g1~~TRINITY_DN7659_c0_g1_i1.p1  ORF type:complete len:582 (+),score=113.88 TRINITY_DN7659_c0_g1_i1:1250-2995(+)